jgi:hypothetical protein
MPARTHGMSRSPETQREYKIWVQMIQRCHNPNDAAFPRYGGRGIVVCERWRNSFEAWHEDMGRRPAGTSIDRIENGGNYEPGNCRWATRIEQMLNSRAVVAVVVGGQTMSFRRAARALGTHYQSLQRLRMRHNFSHQEVVDFYARTAR